MGTVAFVRGLERTFSGAADPHNALLLSKAAERDVVRLSHMEGHTHEAIAEQLGIPVGTVKSRSGRAHKRLAVALAHLTANQPDAHDVQEGEDPR